MPDLVRFKGTWPYASELFGVYQPLLGWRARQARDRAMVDSRRLLDKIVRGARQDARLHRYGSYALDDPVPLAIEAPLAAQLPAWLESSVARADRRGRDG